MGESFSKRKTRRGERKYWGGVESRHWEGGGGIKKKLWYEKRLGFEMRHCIC